MDWKTIDYFTDESLVEDPYPYFDELRAQCPVLPLEHLGVVAQDQHSDAVAEPKQQTAADKQESAESLALAASIALVAGTVVALGGVAWIVVRASSASASATSNAWLLPLATEWRF